MSPEESHFRNTAHVNPGQWVRGAGAWRNGGIKGIMSEQLLCKPRAAGAEANLKDAAHTGPLPQASLVPSPATFSLPFHFSLTFSLLLLTVGPSCGPDCCIGFQSSNSLTVVKLPSLGKM